MPEMKPLKIIVISFIFLLVSSLLIACGSGTCNTQSGEFLFVGYNFGNNVSISGTNTFVTPAGQESYGQFTLSGNANFAMRIYTNNPNLQVTQATQTLNKSFPTGNFIPTTLQVNSQSPESNSYLIIQSESNLAIGTYKLNLYADPVNNSAIANHTYLGYIRVQIVKPTNSTIFISNDGGRNNPSGIISCSINAQTGRLSNCSNFTSESYFNSQLLSPNGIATAGNKLYLVDTNGSAAYPVWQCTIESGDNLLAACQGYIPESLGLTSNDLKSPQGLTINGNNLYITAQNTTPSSAYIYACNIDNNNSITNCNSSNITPTGTINAAPIAANNTNIFTLFHSSTTFLNTGTITCNSNVANCNVESSSNSFTPFTSLTGINAYNNNIILTGDNLNGVKNYTGALLCDNSFNKCITTGPNLIAQSLATSQFGINNGLIFIPLKDLNISNPASKIEICAILPNGTISDQCILQDAQTIDGLTIPLDVAFYNSP